MFVMVKYKSVAIPESNLTYDEWLEKMKTKNNTIVSSVYWGRSIMDRIEIDESQEYKSPQSPQVKETGILFDIKEFFSKFKGMFGLPILFGEKIGKEFKK
jgi:hypothetical protein